MYHFSCSCSTSKWHFKVFASTASIWPGLGNWDKTAMVWGENILVAIRDAHCFSTDLHLLLHDIRLAVIFSPQKNPKYNTHHLQFAHREHFSSCISLPPALLGVLSTGYKKHIFLFQWESVWFLLLGLQCFVFFFFTNQPSFFISF